MTLLFNKAFIIILVEYFNYNNIFIVKNIVEFLKYIEINDYTIKLNKDKQLFFRFIYNLEPIKLEILKIFIKTNINNCFI